MTVLNATRKDKHASKSRPSQFSESLNALITSLQHKVNIISLTFGIFFAKKKTQRQVWQCGILRDLIKETPLISSYFVVW